MSATSTDASGVKIEHVIRGSPAEKAGVKESDKIVRVDTLAVSNSSDVTRLVSRHAPGDAVIVALSRDGKEVTIRATVAARPSIQDMARMEHVGTYAPAWTKLTTVSGTMPASVSALRGKVALIEFWATWCGPCRLTQPALGALASKYGAQGLSVVGITSDDAQLAADHARKTSMGFPAATDGDGSTNKAYGVSSLPTLFVVDKTGIVRDVVVGWEPGQEAKIEKQVQTLLAEPAPP
jgi:thiol-disulfide isomerase/thioredoxin